MVNIISTQPFLQLGRGSCTSQSSSTLTVVPLYHILYSPKEVALIYATKLGIPEESTVSWQDRQETLSRGQYRWEVVRYAS